MPHVLPFSVAILKCHTLDRSSIHRGYTWIVWKYTWTLDRSLWLCLNVAILVATHWGYTYINCGYICGYTLWLYFHSLWPCFNATRLSFLHSLSLFLNVRRCIVHSLSQCWKMQTSDRYYRLRNDAQNVTSEWPIYFLCLYNASDKTLYNHSTHRAFRYVVQSSFYFLQTATLIA